MSNLIRYSITIVQFNLSNLIGFDCSFLGHSPLSIQELQSYRGVLRQTHCHQSLIPAELELLSDSAAGSDSEQLDHRLDNRITVLRLYSQCEIKNCVVKICNSH